MPVLYKILFEVRLLHEYYLTTAKGETVFDLPTQENRFNFIQDKFSASLPSIQDVLKFEFAETEKNTKGEHNFRLLPTYTGFKIGIKVSADKLPDGSTAYKPVSAFDDQSTFSIIAKKLSSSIDQFTNSRFNRSTGGFYYFSNDDFPGTKTFPFLSNPVSGFVSSQKYELGEIVQLNTNDIRSCNTDKPVEEWRKLPGNHYLNENDRILHASRFTYRFNNPGSFTQAVFQLKDTDGNTVTELSRPVLPGIKDWEIDLSRLNLNTIPGHRINKNIAYTYTVETDNGFSENGKIIFANTGISTRDQWALFQINPLSSNNAFRLIDDNGYIHTRKQADGSIIPPQVFEIFIPSRTSFWRYINSRKQSFDPNPANYYSDFLSYGDKALTTLLPRSLTGIHTQFAKTSGGSTTYYSLPNPLQHQLIRIEENKFFTDIIIPEMDKFKPPDS